MNIDNKIIILFVIISLVALAASIYITSKETNTKLSALNSTTPGVINSSVTSTIAPVPTTIAASTTIPTNTAVTNSNELVSTFKKQVCSQGYSNNSSQYQYCLPYVTFTTTIVPVKALPSYCKFDYDNDGLINSSDLNSAIIRYNKTEDNITIFDIQDIFGNLGKSCIT
jgi:hypothetical protein